MTTARLEGELPSGIRRVGLVEVPPGPGVVRRFVFERWQHSKAAGAALAESSGLMGTPDLSPSQGTEACLQIEGQQPSPPVERSR